jgi:hypothetical protein
MKMPAMGDSSVEVRVMTTQTIGGLQQTLSQVASPPTQRSESLLQRLSADVASIGTLPMMVPTWDGKPPADAAVSSGKTQTQALWYAAKAGAIGAVVGALPLPLVGTLATVSGGAIAGFLLRKGSPDKWKAAGIGAAIGLGSSLLPIGLPLRLMGTFGMMLPLSMVVSGAAWGIAAYYHARGKD